MKNAQSTDCKLAIFDQAKLKENPFAKFGPPATDESNREVTGTIPEPTAEWISFIALAAGVAAVPPILILLLGWWVLWVGRGFRSS